MSAKKVVVYFDDHRDALGFTLAAGSVLSGQQFSQARERLVEQLARASRVRVGRTSNDQDHSEPTLLAK